MLQNLLASLGALAIVVVAFVRMILQAKRPSLSQPAGSSLARHHRRRPF
ncbi:MULTISPECIES: hypothetical protein [Bradyrhizobium]|uniref:Uncharacterized protein n=1 Tax=Bradyrhizobium elkanii TaxID=29448 RepID=A0A8I1Y5R8_BRAEL|nr:MULTISPECIES: hypothetical protein [Bradyrhizobium]MBP1293770.1 hypothetical protein [Bradyrhizobium elkanii]MCP1925646.1 hypothetical protein [Bradyrhizobium elkanii]MCS3451283.1 hypothetical protein [Bradyrhizobium elkanii]MCS3476862.1 hypothetical protein [Bradyrhizobium elkanii]MCS3566692.1 hypothetical protein [Bradyrhizobium elkanii]